MAKNLVRHDPEGRYQLHELVRQYAEARLNENPDDKVTTSSNHCQYYIALLERYEPILKSAEQKQATLELMPEGNNLIATWDWAVTNHDVSAIGRAVRPLYWLYEMKEWYHEGLALFRRAEEELCRVRNDPAQALALGQVLTGRGWFHWRLGEFLQAREQFQRSLQLLITHRDLAVLADATTYLGHILSLMGDFEQGRILLAEGIAMHKSNRDLWGAAIGLSMSGRAALEQGDYRTAQALFQESLEMDEPRITAFNLVHLGEVLHCLGWKSEAQARLFEGLTMSRAMDDHFVIGKALMFMGQSASVHGDIQAAELNLLESVALFRKIGDPWSLAQALVISADISIKQGNLPPAQECLHEALRIAKEMQLRPVALEALSCTANLYVESGKEEIAFELVKHILGHPSSPQSARDRAGTLQAKRLSRLTHQTIEAVQVSAQGKTLETLVREILNYYQSP